MRYTRRNLLTAGLAVSASSLIANAPLPQVETAAVSKKEQCSPVGGFQPTWSSLRSLPSPQWLRDSKFGIYTHWGFTRFTASARTLPGTSIGCTGTRILRRESITKKPTGPSKSLAIRTSFPSSRQRSLTPMNGQISFKRREPVLPVPSPSIMTGSRCGIQGTHSGTLPEWDPRGMSWASWQSRSNGTA